jgi:hypothetical protein
MIDNGYFAEGMGCEPGEDTVLEPQTDEVVVFEEFFTAGSRIPPHSILSDFSQVQLHLLTPNTMVQLSKYIWAVANFRGIPSADGFAKRSKLHYEPRKMDVNRAEVQGQYGCINFHAKRYGGQGVKLIIATKNKWARGWTQVWFYYKVPLFRSPAQCAVKVCLCFTWRCLR